MSEKRSLDWPCRFESIFLKIIELYVKKNREERRIVERGKGWVRPLTLHGSLSFFFSKKMLGFGERRG